MTDPAFKDTPLRAVRRDYLCKCGGLLKPTGMTFMCHPPLYDHVCDKCKQNTTLSNRSGSVVYIPIPAE